MKNFSIIEQISNRMTQAKEILSDSNKMDEFLKSLEEKLASVPVIGEDLVEIPAVINMLRDYKNKKYKDIPIGGILAIIAALLYFISVLDVIPDTIPLIGYLDDVAVVNYALKFIRGDIHTYSKWKKEQEDHLESQEEVEDEVE